MKTTVLGATIAVSLSTSLMLCMQTAPAAGPAFEVATLKQNISGIEGGGAGVRGDRFTATNLPLRSLINYAYAPPKGLFLTAQVIGAPEWTRIDKYDVQAKIPGPPGSVSQDDVKLMVQRLLEDRCQLKAHREKRELPVYALVVAKGGMRIKEAPDQTPPPPGRISFSANIEDAPPLQRGWINIAGSPSDTLLTADAVPISKLVPMLQGQADRIIIDKTDDKALYDFSLHYNREIAAINATANAAAVDSTLPSFFTAIQELGLRLEPSKAMLDVVVVDSVQKPNE